MNNTNCLFCKIIKNEIFSKKILENEDAIAILDAFPVCNGHILIIPKKHFDNFLSTDDNVLLNINKLAKLAINLLKILLMIF